jgi:mRNA-degrading endonuclease RelE of RelBE toxin-antitoxin system
MKINYTKPISDGFFAEKLQKRIARKMRFYAGTENPLRFSERLTDYKDANFRFRIGEYRIMFDVVDSSIFILSIRHRKEAYR